MLFITSIPNQHERLTMKTFLRYQDLPSNNLYLGSENPDGSIYEEVQNLIDEAIEPVGLVDNNGKFYHFFDIGVTA